MSDPISVPQSWDVCIIGGTTTPGVCEVDGDLVEEWDVKKGKGANGATTTFVGAKPAEFTGHFKIWEPAHFTAWQALLPQLRAAKKGPGARALSFYHPAVAELEISSVVVKKIGIIKHEGNGLYSRDVEFLQYNPPPPVSAVSTPSGSDTAFSPDALLPDPQIVGLQNARDAGAAQMQAVGAGLL